ncbi:MAG: MBL fold metallo-hydrolase [Roseovarius sp.]|uniref:MBL fold metallo-hydrolase n=1 Tax=Roseovarius sp. TaxID=1486281 RepID=UPI0032ED5E8C
MEGHGRQIRYPVETPPEIGEAIEIADGILWFRIPLPMVLNHVNVYALDDGDGWSIIDTGLDTRKTRDIWQAVLSGPLGGKPVRRVIVTHHHPDHVGLAGWFQSAHGAELVTTRTAWLFARMLALDVHDAPTPETVAHWRGAGMSPDVLERRMIERPFNFADILTPMPLGFTRIREGDTLVAGGRSWSVKTGNGHAPEHATFWAGDESLVIGGDQLLPSISPNLGVYATEPEADPVAEWLESCERFRTLGDDDRLVLPGHKLPFTGLAARMDQLIENHEGALRRLEAFLSEPRTAVDCFPVLFKRKIGDGEYGLALVEAVAHCLHLWHAGRVTRRLRDDGAWLWQRVD